MDISKEALVVKLNQTEAQAQKPLKKPRQQPTATVDRQTFEYNKLQDHFVALMLLQPRLREYLELTTLDMFTYEPAQQLVAFLKANLDFDGKPETAAPLKSIGDYVKIIVLQYEELYQGLEFTELHYEAARLQARLVEKFVKYKKEHVVSQLEGADEASTTALLEQVRELDTLLKHVKGATHAQRQED